MGGARAEDLPLLAGEAGSSHLCRWPACSLGKRLALAGLCWGLWVFQSGGNWSVPPGLHAKPRGREENVNTESRFVEMDGWRVAMPPPVLASCWRCVSCPFPDRDM